MKNICSFIIMFQGVYYLITGLWSLFHYESFEMMTGPKTDDWLVKTVGLLIAVIGLTLLVAIKKRDNTITIILAGGTALSLALIDIFYFLNGKLTWAYLFDAALEALFLIAVICLINSRMEKPGYRFE